MTPGGPSVSRFPELIDRDCSLSGRKRFCLLPKECTDKTAFMKSEGERKGLMEKTVKRDPVFRLLMGVIAGMFIWNMVLASSPLQPFFGLVSGGWYFLLLLWFYAGTGRKHRWETVVFLIIGIICHFYWLWSVATPGYLRSDAQAGLIFIFGGFWAGGTAILCDAAVYVLVQLFRWSFRPEDDSPGS